MRSIRRGLWVAVAVLACLVCESQAIGASQKLFLKDGTYQLVSSYEVHGDRVRYYSVERSAWEEIPLSLVDLETTKRSQEQEKGAQKKQLEEGREIERQRFEKPLETGFEIAPGVRLPKEDGVYAYDGERVIRLIQTTAELVTDKKRAALALAVPAHLLKSRSVAVLPGPKAAVRLQQAQPTFYVQSSEGLGTKLEVVSVKVVKETRVVEKVEAEQGSAGKPSDLHVAVQLQRTQLAPGLFRLMPLHPMDPGEYALGDLAQQGLNLEFWDFGLFETPSKHEMKKPPRSDKSKSRESKVEELRAFRPSTPRLLSRARFLSVG
jgi:hypothetical protein